MGKAPCYAILQDYSRDMGKSSYDQGRRNRDTKLKHHIEKQLISVTEKEVNKCVEYFSLYVDLGHE